MIQWSENLFAFTCNAVTLCCETNLSNALRLPHAENNKHADTAVFDSRLCVKLSSIGLWTSISPMNCYVAGKPATVRIGPKLQKWGDRRGYPNPLKFNGLIRVKYGLDTTSILLWKTRGFVQNLRFFLEKYGLIRVKNGLDTSSIRVWLPTLYFFRKTQQSAIMCQ